MNSLKRTLREQEYFDVTEAIWQETLAVKSELVHAGLVPLDKVDEVVDAAIEKQTAGYRGTEKLMQARKVFQEFRCQIDAASQERQTAVTAREADSDARASR